MKSISRTLNIWESPINYVEGFEDETVREYSPIWQLNTLIVNDCKILPSNSWQ